MSTHTLRFPETRSCTCLTPRRTPAKLQLVVDCLRIQRIEPFLVQVGGRDEYHSLLRDAWSIGQEFFVVEQDIVVWYGAIPLMEECEEDWCTLATVCHGREITTTFGCVKFGKGLIERRPNFWDSIPTDWFHLDANFADKMGWPFIKPHSHWPVATHLNEVQWSDEVSTRMTLERKITWRSMEEGGAVASVQNQDGRVQHAVVESNGLIDRRTQDPIEGD
jgi:hypothetical protein